jgi:2-polyprenyl-3-methyl-5-hydroxy-6-metoxy-1,4-benzoquinol methylase
MRNALIKAFHFDLPLDAVQREIAGVALQKAGAPFSLQDPAVFRDKVRIAWGYYQALRDKARPRGLRRLTYELDRQLYRRRNDEYLDDPKLDEKRRWKIVDDLDKLNQTIRSYRWFLASLGAYAAEKPGNELSVLDIGSGHGAFPIYLANEGELAGKRIQVTGSDISPVYVAKAQAKSLREKVRVEFRQLDALQLDRMEERFDIITSSQTIHHFGPGFLAELLARVSKNARQGVIFFDDRRSPAVLAGAAVATALVGRGDPWFVHDAVVSVRRMYSPAELEMLARCAPGGETYRAQNMGPAYTVLKTV